MDLGSTAFQPYRFEPDSDADNEEAPDVQHPRMLQEVSQWCTCGNCAKMPTGPENICCREIPQVTRRMKQLKDQPACMVDHPGLEPVCLNEFSLQKALNIYNADHGPLRIRGKKQRSRFLARWSFVSWCWGFLGRRVGVVLPACVVLRIQAQFPDAEGSGPVAATTAADAGLLPLLQNLLSLLWLLQENLLLLLHCRQQRTAVDNCVRYLLLDPPRRAARRATRRFWVRPGRTSSWWDTFVSRVALDSEWRENLCMSRASVMALSEELRPHIEGQTTNMRAPIDVPKKVAMTLYYLREEGSLRRTSNAFGVSRQAVSIIVKQTCKAIAVHLGPKYIKLPFTAPEAEDLVLGFQRAHGMPQCLGAVGSTHIEIKQPPANSADYVNRRGRHSLNVQAACDFRFRFMEVETDWPGSVHDAQVFLDSELNRHFRTGNVPPLRKRIVADEEPIPIFLLGDPAHPLLPYLVTEYPDGGSTPQERCFGSRLRGARVVIERGFGRLKARFAALKRPVDINLKDLPHLIYACFVLHNLCEASRETVDDDSAEAAARGAEDLEPLTRSGVLTDSNQEGMRVRRVLTKFLDP